MSSRQKVIAMQNNSGQLAGKVVLISGGAGGLGAAFARHILARGGSVVLADLLDDEGDKLVGELGPQARYAHLDVTDPEQWAAAVQFTLDEFGSLNGLVNNAGVSTGQFLEHEPLAHFRMVLEINLVGVFNGLQAVIKPMRFGGRRVDRQHLVCCGTVRLGVHRGLRGLEVGSARTVEDRRRRARAPNESGSTRCTRAWPPPR